MVNDKLFEHRPVSELFAIVRNSLPKFDNEGLIDDGTLIKHVMWCNDKLGLPIREVREIAIPVQEFRANLPADFEKLYYVCALEATNTMITDMVNPFDNNFDQDIVYDAKLDRESLGCVDAYQVVVKRQSNVTVHTHGTWIDLDISGKVDKMCHIDCPNKRKKGRYTIQIEEDHIETPFKAGTLYIMYIGLMKDKDGNVTFPFHPLITPFYEWYLKENILLNAIFNSDAAGMGELYKLATSERVKAQVDAMNITMNDSYREFQKSQRKRELGWYNQYFKYFQ